MADLNSFQVTINPPVRLHPKQIIHGSALSATQLNKLAPMVSALDRRSHPINRSSPNNCLPLYSARPRASGGKDRNVFRDLCPASSISEGFLPKTCPVRPGLLEHLVHQSKFFRDFRWEWGFHSRPLAPFQRITAVFARFSRGFLPEILGDFCPILRGF